MRHLVVPGRYCGPPSSGNGGWTAGAMATQVGRDHPESRAARPAVEVTLRSPPPLDKALTITQEGELTIARHGSVTVAEARLVDTSIASVAPVEPRAARAASAGYAGFQDHPFPTCFSCGPAREPGDGLRIFPGPIGDAGSEPDGQSRVAATWTPDASVRDAHLAGRASNAVTWAALDCVGGWSTDIGGRPLVLGRIIAQVLTLPLVGEEYVVVGRHLRTAGRRSFTASAIFDATGGLVGRAEHVWVAVHPSTFAGSS